MIIGVIGNKRHGKDTIGNYLVSNYGFVRYAFADCMKEMVKIMFLWDERYVNGDLKEVVDFRWGISPRQALQLIGTEFGQIGLCNHVPSFKEITGRKVWVKRFKLWYNSIDKKPNVVITDVRFPHELEVLKELNAKTIKVIRPDLISKDLHESEKYVNMLKVDYEIVNNKTIPDLHNKIKEIMKEILNG
jgi:hypothetical protein